METRHRRPGWRRGMGLAVVLGAALLAGWGWQQRAPAAVEIATAEASRGDIEQRVTALGKLQPRDYVDVGAQVSGQLVRLHVAVGERVAEGDLLAEIEADVQRARVEAGRAQLAAQEAQLAERQAQRDLARQQYQRQQRLLTSQATSEDAYQVARAALLTSEAQIQALQAQIEQSRSSLRAEEATLGHTRIYAPMDGTVVSLAARQGQMLNANQAAPLLMRIADLATMTVWTEVSEADVSRLAPGMRAYFSPLGLPEARWEGELRQVLPTPEILNNVVLYTALFDVDNADGRLMTEMTARVSFVLAEARDVLRVPVAALARGGASRDRLTVVGPEGALEEREVTVGVSDRVQAEITEGLAEGERVALASAGPRPGTGERPRLPRGLP